MTENLLECSPFCKSFRCDRNPSALKIRRKSNEKEIWCTWVDDTCDGAWCQYSICLDRKMGETGNCKRVDKPVEQVQVQQSEDFADPSRIPKKYAKKLRGKTNL